jgi:hypothetical protein
MVESLSGLAFASRGFAEFPADLFGNVFVLRLEPGFPCVRKEAFVPGEKRAEYPIGQDEGVIYLNLKLTVTGSIAALPRRPFGGAHGQNQATSDKHGWPHLRPIWGLDKPTDFALG